MEKLLLLIGKGQKELTREGDKIKQMTYREANYFRPDDPDNSIQTPFVGEATAKLYPKRFGEVHIFGTRDAMWDVLYYHCLMANDDELTDEQAQIFDEIEQAVTNRAFDQKGELLDHVAKAFASLTNIRSCRCHLIPLGTNENELWKIFKLMTSPKLELDGHKISIDVTNSLRFHPIFLVLTLNYFQSVSPKTSFGSLFYGAFELRWDYNGLVPILDLNAFIDMMKWVDAAQAFRQYGDATPLAQLIEENSSAPSLVAAMKDFSKAIQMNIVDTIEESAEQLTGQLSPLDDNLPPALHFIAPRLSEFPNKLNQTERSWKTMLFVARYHFDNGHIGLSVLAAWEAVIERMAEIYQVDGRDHDNYGRLSRAARYNSVRIANLPPRKLQAEIRKLSKYRNSIAHANSGQFSDVSQDFPLILRRLEKYLGDSALERLPIEKPWPSR